VDGKMGVGDREMEGLRDREMEKFEIDM